MRAPLRGGGIDVLSQQQARALAHLIHLVREDWNEEGIYKKLGEVRDCDTFAVALAAIRAARDPNARTPGVIPNQAGPHWRELAGQVPQAERRSYNTPCPLHDGETLPCGRCANERVPADAPTALALARAELQSARSRLCPHGVNRKVTRCGDCELPRPTPTTEPTEETAA